MISNADSSEVPEGITESVSVKNVFELVKHGFRHLLVLLLGLLLTYVFLVKPIVTMRCPLVVDLNRDGIINTTLQSSARYKRTNIWSLSKQVGHFVMFDMFGDGEKKEMEWLDGSGDAFIIDIRQGIPRGEINGKYLLGNATGSDNGFEALKAFDTNHDGTVSGSELDSLALWQDNGDAVIENGEIKRFKDVDIEAVSTSYIGDVNNIELSGLVGSAQSKGLYEVPVYDIWLLSKDAINPFDYNFARIISLTILKLPFLS